MSQPYDCTWRLRAASFNKIFSAVTVAAWLQQILIVPEAFEFLPGAMFKGRNTALQEQKSAPKFSMVGKIKKSQKKGVCLNGD